MNDLDAGIELPLDAHSFQTYSQILNLVLTQCWVISADGLEQAGVDKHVSFVHPVNRSCSGGLEYVGPLSYQRRQHLSDGTGEPWLSPQAVDHQLDECREVAPQREHRAVVV